MEWKGPVGLARLGLPRWGSLGVFVTQAAAAALGPVWQSPASRDSGPSEGLQQPQQTNQRLSVQDFAPAQHLSQFGEAELAHADAFVGLGLCLGKRQMRCLHQVHALCQEAWTGVKAEHASETPGAVPRFFHQFAEGSGAYRLPRI